MIFCGARSPRSCQHDRLIGWGSERDARRKRLAEDFIQAHTPFHPKARVP
jgi:hypothetical protein